MRRRPCADTDGDGLLDHGEFLRLAREATEAVDADGRRRCLRVVFGMNADNALEAAGGGGQYIHHHAGEPAANAQPAAGFQQ